ncbi:DUF3027 domain-containing protein [Actinomadura decatromicini]|uniref:DUF3027 domain-containing protein n=1 Tax=Actinomadura decatromicini TaxID=2604572 RepID=A0A5D3FRC6_9ACTN|nr:DUF3027 domain-containing protein [Actinomadura decatromicini]
MGENRHVSPLRQTSPARSASARTTSGPARRTRTPAVDTACAEAVDIAREAAADTASPGQVGEHLGLRAEGDRVVTHYFECLDQAYEGWRWAVTVTRASRAKNVTVSECVLLPGDDALLAPPWVPWLERLRPGDLGPGDLLPTAPDDVRLAPGYTEVDDSGDRQADWELGLGRVRVLSREGRDEAAERWYDGVGGPRAPIAASAPAQCSTCGFYVALAGELRQLFGVCANEYAPDDGRVVSADHGCGAHSEAVSIPAVSEHSPPVIDELGYEVVPASPADEAAADAAVDDAAPLDDEALGHS